MSTSTNRTADVIAAARALALPDVCTAEDVARHLKLSAHTIRKWLIAGVLPGTKLGRRWYVTREALLAHLRQRSMRVVAS